MALSRTDLVDTWLRAQGLPYLVPRERRAHDLLQRAAPATVLLFGVLVLGVLGGPSLAAAVDRAGDPLGAASGSLVLVVLAVAIVVPVIVAAWVHRRMREWSDPRGRSVALGLAVAYAVCAAVLALLTDEGLALVIAEAVGLLLVAHLAVWSGLASVVAWAARWAWQSVGALQNMASRALPVILVLVVFAFFSTEAWQIADSMGSRRQWALTALIALIAILAMLPVARGELSTAHRDLTPDQVHALLVGTPLEDAPTGTVSGQELAGGGRLNVLAVLIVAHLIQAAMFTLVIATLLVAIGRIAITDAVVRTWLSHPREPYQLLGQALPVDQQTVRTALLLGVIGALSFVLSSLSDASYRSLFFDPLVERVKVAVAAHRALAG